MKGKKILIGISGSIAAYKIPQLVRLLTKAGAEVKVVMTPQASNFVSPLVLSTLTQNPVGIEMFNENTWSNHVMLGRWADVFLITPASCNTLAKMASGICDNFLLAVYLSATCPIIIAPAMDEDMWEHASTKKNISTLKSFGNKVLNTEHGSLASGLVGMGRMAEVETLFEELNNFFYANNQLAGKQILVTAGPTYENIDPVRFIGNYSSGKMGIAIAEELALRGATVHLVLGPSTQKVNPTNIILKKVTSAAEMMAACDAVFDSCDIAIMSAAVADYSPITIADEKIKKQDGSINLELKKTADIIGTLGKRKKENQLLIGFALESQNEKAYALGKLEKKNADIIVLNSTKDEGATFGHNTNKVTFFDKKGNEVALPLLTKTEVATKLIDYIIAYK